MLYVSGPIDTKCRGCCTFRLSGSMQRAGLSGEGASAIRVVNFGAVYDPLWAWLCSLGTKLMDSHQSGTAISLVQPSVWSPD